MAMRAVEYVRCATCNRFVNVYFAHGAIQVYPCRSCCSIRSILKRMVTKFFKSKPPRGT